MRGYQSIFSAATGITHIPTLERIEEIVRTTYGTLGHLYRETLEKEARIAVEVMKQLGEFDSEKLMIRTTR